MKRLASLALSLILLLGALGLLYTAYRRVSTPIRLMRGSAVVVDGVITEKLPQHVSDSLLPFDVPAYVVRYAFPNPQGQMRTGEQIVTRGFFDRLGDQGAPAQITLLVDDAAVNAVDPRLTFPGVAGWRLGIAVGLAVMAYGIFLVWGLKSEKFEARGEKSKEKADS